MTCRECLEETCSGAALFLCNGIDLACGLTLVAYGAYLGINHFAPTWLFAPILGLGGMLVLTSLLSWCGSSCRSCTSLLLISSWLLTLVALLELVMAIVIMTQGDAITDFLKQHQEELHLTDDELALLESHKFVPAYILFGLFGMELLRFCCSSCLRRSRLENKYARMNLKSLRGMEDNLVQTKKEREVSAKYQALKDKYRSKYAGENDQASSLLLG
ncbi:hypothetical protein SPRG_04647 [Saprolegnia parasitica CBS 223.65]|uniref:Uncharacterized protein n=1 Tax=Saprolegnia parasitica (strain CBS 223.65) TaxID=695850 RepID=A0A067CW63_SAPPC|nr:hypothetical protein SPRG_04647 [Saprolegnia parasitica CBS 223.65]KDO30746.1 hypothetical protein SPRG_04647 [Saprolegnia parasitica CBS 223.65]|eukprot:XP_012198446.1 hypothetical protein SPRG_04647 [Saprolegnia parasitica CBS 223.65]